MFDWVLNMPLTLYAVTGIHLVTPQNNTFISPNSAFEVFKIELFFLCV